MQIKFRVSKFHQCRTPKIFFRNLYGTHFIKYIFTKCYCQSYVAFVTHFICTYCVTLTIATYFTYFLHTYVTFEIETTPFYMSVLYVLYFIITITIVWCNYHFIFRKLLQYFSNLYRTFSLFHTLLHNVFIVSQIFSLFHSQFCHIFDVNRFIYKHNSLIWLRHSFGMFLFISKNMFGFFSLFHSSQRILSSFFVKLNKL